MSATKKILPSGEMRTSCGMPRVVQIAPPSSGASCTSTGLVVMSCDFFFSSAASWATTSGRCQYGLRVSVPSTVRFTMSILVTAPSNSQVNSA